MPLTAAQMKAAQAAQRMLADEPFLAVLKRIADEATQQAVFGTDLLEREAQRQMALAIARLLGELQYDAELPEVSREADVLAKGFE